MVLMNLQNLDRDFLILLNDVARLLRTRFDQMARTRGMTRAQWVILARLSRQPGMSQNELASLCEVEPITVGRLIDRLEARGLVERRSDPKDRRVRRLHLLPAAQPFLEEITSYKEMIAREISDDIDKQTQEVLVDALIGIKSKLTAEGASSPKLQMAGE
ncbi:MAG: MarR family winged helix-turn-helix transcriptional regulator [Rhizomicrobium sp.]